MIPMKFYRLLPVMTLVWLTSCGNQSSSPENDYPLRIRVRTSTGEPLAGSGVRIGARAVGTTDADGALAATTRGREGQSVEVGVQCPTGYKSTSASEPVRLTQMRALDAPSALPGIRVEATCESERREVVIVVRAKGGGGLPLNVGAEVAGQTDSEGNAYVVLQLPREQNSIELGLDTDLHRELSPRNPSRSFTLGHNDALVFYSEQLTIQSRKTKSRVRTVAPVIRRTIPVRLN